MDVMVGTIRRGRHGGNPLPRTSWWEPFAVDVMVGTLLQGRHGGNPLPWTSR